MADKGMNLSSLIKLADYRESLVNHLSIIAMAKAHMGM